MQNKKQYILEKAFEVFMAKGYDSASMTVLHQELKISRGAMYRYFESKDDLFIQVIDKYFFEAIERLMPQYSEDITVPEQIKLIYRHQQQIANYLDDMAYTEAKFLNYTALAIQAAKRYPGFLNKLKKYKERAFNGWAKSIQKSIEKGDVKKETNVKIMARIFTQSMGFFDNETNHFDATFSKGFKNNKKIMDYIYSLIQS